MKTFVHVFDNCIQNWFSVASIIEDVLRQLKQTDPRIKEAFLRSDNAGCYHCGPLMLTIRGISKRMGIQIRRYDFSDPQSGKDICDRRIATMKSHMRRYLNEGNNIISASDMKRALDSYGGVKGCRVSVVSVDTSKQDITQHKWTGIQSFNNFEFQRLGIRVWKAYGIGKGKLMRTQDLKKMSKPQKETGLIVHENFTNPAVNTGEFKKLKTKDKNDTHDKTTKGNVTNGHDDDQELQRGFACPEVGCVKVFVSRKNLGEHLDSGKHFYRIHKEGMYDIIKRKWQSKCVTVGSVKVSTSERCHELDNGHEQEKELSPQSRVKGWALKKPKGGVRFTQSVRDFLNQTFLKGEETGQKANPVEVSSRLRNLRTTDGKKMFQTSEWLTAQQIANYFSRLSVLHRSGRRVENEEEEAEEATMVDEVLNRQRLAEEIIINLEP